MRRFGGELALFERAGPPPLFAAPARRETGLVSPFPSSSDGKGIAARIAITGALTALWALPIGPRIAALAGVGAVIAGLSAWPALRRWRTRRALDEVPRGLSVRPLRGQRVRVTGIARASSAPFSPALGGGIAIVARYLGYRGAPRSSGARGRRRDPYEGLAWEIHAADFVFEADDLPGVPFLVETQHVRLMPHPPHLEEGLLRQEPILLGGATGREPVWILRQETVQPGDHIEITATFDQTTDPSTASASGRHPRLTPALRGTPDAPVTITLTTPAPRTIVPVPWR
jgi:hypothetical protein